MSHCLAAADLRVVSLKKVEALGMRLVHVA